MKKSHPRDLALGVLNQLTKQGFFLNDQLDRLFETHTYLDDRDKALINQLVQGVLRWRLRLDWIIGQAADSSLKKIHPLALNILRLACLQIFFLDKIPESAAVNEAVLQIKRKKLFHLAAFVNGLLRNLCRSKDRIAFPDKTRDKVRFLSVFYSYPEWLVQKWLAEFGMENCESLLAAGNQIPKTILRVHSLQISRDTFIQHLADQGTLAKPTQYSPMGVELVDFRGRVTELPGFKTGWFQVQDQAAQIAAYLLDPQPHEKVLDLCAGLGGKTSHLAQLMNEQGLIIALEPAWNRLKLQIQNNKRLHIRSVHPVQGDAIQAPFLFSKPFDKILIDAPCSGLGVIHRHPDAKWNRSAADLRLLPDFQNTFLHAAGALLRPGGKILYVTCTLNPEENERVIEHFLKTHKDFQLAPLKQTAPDWAKPLINENDFLQTFPSIHGMDGFFAALLIRE
ncbi:MAG: 16S rRNA (cytosine(967)-C(5))-methyltransferase RsmB [Desulfobacteraceae bacterium]|nr:MAG: 16S rRNA (cytosine(967)-C(5))-methyltransferase RsmB [Desulfobacteraceae bacterium]